MLCVELEGQVKVKNPLLASWTSRKGESHRLMKQKMVCKETTNEEIQPATYL
jgi:hypothetical protein